VQNAPDLFDCPDVNKKIRGMVLKRSQQSWDRLGTRTEVKRSKKVSVRLFKKVLKKQRVGGLGGGLKEGGKSF